MTNYINKAKQQFGNISLTENYRKKMFAKNFGSHLNQLFEVSEVLDNSEHSIFRNKDIVVTDRIYWQTEGMVLEQLDDVVDNTVLNELDNLEDMLHENIKVAMGKNYERSSELNKIIDHTIHGILLSVKYNYFSEKDRYTNPWEDAKNILTENLVLFSFSSDVDEMQQLGYTPPKNESAEIRQKKIGVIGRGNRPDYNFHYVRDLIGLRNTVVDILADADSHSNPFKTLQIVDELRKMGISKDELSDNNISNFLIAPLKRSGRIGSSNEGYFLLKSCGDVEISYKSHLETLRGFYNTLENHRQLAHRFGCTSNFFDDHRKIFKLDD
jgi:hypothetical protein